MTVTTGNSRALLDVRIAYPGNLGPRIPAPPPGYVPYGTGYVAIDRDGSEVRWNGSSWEIV